MDIDVDMSIDTAIDIGIALDLNLDIAIFPTGVCENNDHPYGKKPTAPRPPRFQCCEGGSQYECARLRNKRLNSHANTGSCSTLKSGEQGGSTIAMFFG